VNGDEEQEAPAGEDAHSLLRRVSTQLAAIQKSAFGKGPTSAKSYLFDDLLLVVMRDGLTTAEQTMVGFDRRDLVRQFRQEFQNKMASRISGIVQDITGRKVLTYQSQIMFDPDLVVEIFVFDRTTGGAFVAAEIREEESDEF
jgi:uncharacterized protein YbcI